MSIGNYARFKSLTPPPFNPGKSVQGAIPIAGISPDGIFQITRQGKHPGKHRRNHQGMDIFDKAYLFLDTNYTTKDEGVEKESFFQIYCRFLNSVNVSFKISILNLRRDMEALESELFLSSENETLSPLVKAFNELIEERAGQGRKSIDQLRVFTISCKQVDYESAKSYFRTLEAYLTMNFNQMESHLIPLSTEGRLKILHGIYRLGKESSFRLSVAPGKDRYPGLMAALKNDICPSGIRYDETYMQIENRYVRVLYASKFPSSLSDAFLISLTDVDFYTITTLDVAPVPRSEAQKWLFAIYSSVGRKTTKKQEQLNKQQNFAADIPYEVRKEQEEIEEYLDINRDGREKLFFAGLYIAVSADSLEELDSHTITLKALSEAESLVLDTHICRQAEAFNTALPIGCRQTDTMRTLFTQSLAPFMPFNVRELFHPQGIHYGVNRISGNLISGDRKRLNNSNAFVLGTSGAGKGVATKTELLQVYLKGKDDIIVIDPAHEYESLAKALKGQFIEIKPGSQVYVNPMAVPESITDAPQNIRELIAQKADLTLSLCEQIEGGGITPQKRSIVERSTRHLYDQYFADKGHKQPTLLDLYNDIGSQPESAARELCLALETFTKGSLDMFSHETSPGLRKHNRLTVYGIRDLGRQMRPVGILVILEAIRDRIAYNYNRGVATWLYVDEFHYLASQKMSAETMERAFKEYRKMGALPTGITQNISDLLVSKTVMTMLANSDFINLLRLSPAEAESLQESLALNDSEIALVTDNCDIGCGLLKFGQSKIPINNKIPKEHLWYDLFNTNFHEMNAAAPVKQKAIKQSFEELVKERETNPKVEADALSGVVQRYVEPLSPETVEDEKEES